MNELVYIIKIVYYYVFVVMMNYSASINLNIPYVFSKKSTIGKSSRVGIVWVIILGFMIGYYAIICGHDPYVSDRYNYAVRFETDGLLDSVRQQSIGLYFIYLILQYFTHDARILFFFITFLCFTVTIKAYNFFEEASKDTLLFLGLSSYIYCSFFLLKQAPAIAFSSLAFSYYLKKRKIAFVVSLFIAIAFHESAWILVLVLLLCKFSENRKMCNFLIIAIMISMIFFNPITHFLAVLFGYIPGLAEQMPAYFLETGINSGDIRYITIFKGAPYYYIFFWGYLKKKILEQEN